jgi:hypothetical protein
MFSVFGKVSQPAPHEFDPFTLNSVNPHPTLPLVSDQPCSLEYSQVPRGGLPCVLEDASDFSGGHSSAVEENRDQHPPSGSVRQGLKHGVVRIAARVRFLPGHAD